MSIRSPTEEEFVADDNRIASFNKRSVIEMLVMSSFVLVPLLILGAYGGKNGLPILGIVVITLLVATGATLAGAERFQKIRIKLCPFSIKRKGIDFDHTEIFYSEIGRVIVKRHGFVIIKKGLGPNLNYYLNKWVLTHSDSVIFIPSLITDYERIKEFFLVMQK